MSLIDHLATNKFAYGAMVEFFRGQKADSSRFPADTEFASALLVKQVYGGGWDRRTRAMLERMETTARDKFDDPVAIQGDLTLEHVLPVQWAKTWPLASGQFAVTDQLWELSLHPNLAPEARGEIEDRCRLVATIGNLVLVNQAKNSKMSNGPFEEKRQLLIDSALKLTRSVGLKDAWGEEAIKARSQMLASLTLQTWRDIHPG